MRIWMSPADPTEDTHSDTKKKMKATPCPRLIQLAPLHRCTVFLEAGNSPKPRPAGQRKESSRVWVLSPHLVWGWADRPLPRLHVSPAQISPENCEVFLLPSRLWFSSHSILFSEVLLVSLLWNCQHPVFPLYGSNGNQASKQTKKMEIWLPVSPKAKFVRQMLVQKERKRFHLGAMPSGRIADFYFKAHLLTMNKTKASIQSSHSNLKFSPLEATGCC